MDLVSQTASGGLLTVQDVCEFLRIGRTKAYELIDSGLLPSVKIGALRRIPRQAVIDLARDGLPTEERSGDQQSSNPQRGSADTTNPTQQSHRCGGNS
jgi:excisionase family DNA binding protein